MIAITKSAIVADIAGAIVYTGRKKAADAHNHRVCDACHGRYNHDDSRIDHTAGSVGRI